MTYGAKWRNWRTVRSPQLKTVVDRHLTRQFFLAPRLDVRPQGGAQCQANADQRIGYIDVRLSDEQGPLEAT